MIEFKPFFVALCCFIAACADSEIFRPENLPKTVRSIGDGRYSVIFRTVDIEPFGGIQNMAVSVPRYIEDRHLVPPECRRGVVFLSGGSYQGGREHAAGFRCAE